MMKYKVDVNKFREMVKPLLNGGDADAMYTFYWDETNNFRKLHIEQDGFSYPIYSLENFFQGLKLQSNIRDVKLKHLVKGDFLDCLQSPRLNYFLKGILDCDGWIHYQNVNFLYRAIVDIVDSVIAHSSVAGQLGGDFGRYV